MLEEEKVRNNQGYVEKVLECWPYEQEVQRDLRGNFEKQSSRVLCTANLRAS